MQKVRRLSAPLPAQPRKHAIKLGKTEFLFRAPSPVLLGRRHLFVREPDQRDCLIPSLRAASIDRADAASSCSSAKTCPHFPHIIVTMAAMVPTLQRSMRFDKNFSFGIGSALRPQRNVSPHGTSIRPSGLPLITVATAARMPPKCLIQLVGAPEGIRTPDLCLRRAALYPAELRAPNGREYRLDSRMLPIRQRPALAARLTAS